MTMGVRLVCVVLALLFGALSLSTIAPGPALAQPHGQTESPDYDAWQQTALRAEQAVETARASSEALESLRAQLVSWRTQFVEAQGTNANAIATVQSQLTALGPAPEDGTEDADIAQSRRDLNTRLTELMAPVRAAELARNRADGLIAGIDRILRERQSEALLELGPTPVNPLNWKSAVVTLTSTVRALHAEFVAGWHNPLQRTKARDNLPVTLLFLAVGVLLVLRGRRWTRRLTGWMLRDQPGSGRWISAFVVSLGSIILPFLGILLLVSGIRSTGLLGLRLDQLLESIIRPIFYFLVARWISVRVFPLQEDPNLPLNLDTSQRGAGRLCGGSLGLFAGFYFYLSKLADLYNWSAASTNVILFPFVVLVAVTLLRLAKLLKTHRQNELAEGQADTIRSQITRFLAKALVVLAFVAPALALIGYFKLGHYLLFSSLLSLLLLGALQALQNLIVEIYVLFVGSREKASESLVPVLLGMLLVLGSLPLFAMAWGTRPAQIADLWTQFNEGVNLGGARISPTVFLTFAVVFAIGYLATRLIQGTLKSTILPKTRLDQGGRNAIVSGVGYIGLFLAALFAITSAGVDLSSIAIVAGALSVGIGFGLRTIVENFVSGIILLIERPISEGDWIEVDGVHGTVRDISVRSTRIETFDRSDVIVPNADLVAGRVTNYTRFNTIGRLIAPVGVAYGSDTRKVERTLLDIAESHPMVLANPAPFVLFREFGADSLNFEIRAILRDVNWVMSVHSEINHQIAERFAAEGIEVPFSQRDIWIRNPEAFAGVGAATPPPSNPAPEPTAAADAPLDEAARGGDSAGDGGDR